MKKILVTGSTGFVGRQILNSLLTSDVKLIPVVRIGKEDRIIKSPSIHRIVSTNDIFSESEDWWEQECYDVDVIIHSAWHVTPGEYINSTRNLDCLIGSLQMAKGAVKAGVKHIVGIGTCFEYDLTSGVLSIDTPLRPLTNYAASKTALYFELSHWLAIYKVKFSWCRLFYLYGEGEDENRLVAYIHKQLVNGEEVALTSGRQIRDFMDVKDVGKEIASIALLEKEGTFNVCSGVPVTIKQIAEKIADEYNARSLLKFGARPESLIDPPMVVGVKN